MKSGQLSMTNGAHTSLTTYWKPHINSPASLNTYQSKTLVTSGFSHHLLPLLSQDICAILCQCSSKSSNMEVGMVILASGHRHIAAFRDKKRLGWKASLVVEYVRFSRQDLISLYCRQWNTVIKPLGRHCPPHFLLPSQAKTKEDGSVYLMLWRGENLN